MEILALESQHFWIFLAKSFPVHQEPIEIWNFFDGTNRVLQSFYENREHYIVPFQISVDQTLFQQELNPKNEQLSVFERSLISSQKIFIKFAKLHNQIDAVESDVIEKTLKHLKSLSPIKPDLFIYMRTSPEVAFQHVSIRDRAGKRRFRFHTSKSYLKKVVGQAWTQEHEWGLK